MAVNYKMIGKRICVVRKSQGLSQADLAELAGLSVAYISFIETAAKKASLESLVSIANSLHVSIDQLLGANISRDTGVYSKEYADLMIGCTPEEKQILLSLSASAKECLLDLRNSANNNSLCTRGRSIEL